jgi:hypothetical protein
MTKNFTPLDLEEFKKNRQKSVLLNKESEPIMTRKEINIEEVVESELQKEAAPYLQPRQEIVNLPPELKKLGLHEVSSTKFPAGKTINLPLSDEKIITGLHAPVTSSLRWLAILADYLLKKMHLRLRIVSGKVVRVFRK